MSEDRILFICSAPTKPNGELYWPSAEPKSYSSGKVYTSLFARHWDSWETENKNSLWFGVIVKANGKWTFESPALKNLLAGSRLSSPIPPFGGTGDFDISPYGVVFVAKDPDLNQARYTKTDLYYIPFKPGSEPLQPSAPQLVKTGKLRGYSLTPTFSKDGKKVAFARMKSDQYESDKQRLLLIPDVDDLSNVQEFYETRDGEGGWDRRPDWITWSNDDKTLYVGAEKHGHAVLWALPSSPLLAREPPKALIEKGSVVEAKTLGIGKDLFVSSRSLVESSSYSILDPVSGSNKEVSSSSKHGKSLGLNESQTGEIWFPGSYGYDVHALVVKPSHFDETKKYPVAMLIHGGPQGAWNDDWSTRWNPAIFAEQGYLTVCPNPTGSTGYGQAHTDAVSENWGGNPYEDLVKCFEYLDKEIEYADMDRAVALGGSYGGYMISKLTESGVSKTHRLTRCRLDSRT
jgi:dipeptidyl aminopeptidase/acylaminoacyl peptidase